MTLVRVSAEEKFQVAGLSFKRVFGEGRNVRLRLNHAFQDGWITCLKLSPVIRATGRALLRLNSVSEHGEVTELSFERASRGGSTEAGFVIVHQVAVEKQRFDADKPLFGIRRRPTVRCIRGSKSKDAELLEVEARAPIEIELGNPTAFVGGITAAVVTEDKWASAGMGMS